MMRALCIGGPNDGESRDVPDGHKTVRLIERQPMPSSPFNPNDYAPEAMLSRHSTYQVFELHGPQRHFKLLVHESMTLDGAMHALLQGYKR
jgi:hypothetical protein